jgi:hypothetical protein
MTATAAILNWQPAAPTITGQARMDSRDIAGDILRRQGQMENDRANYESLWQEIADFMLPRAAVFTYKGTPLLRNNIYDSTAVLALDRFSAAFESMLTPRSQTWHMLKPMDDDLADDVEVKRWCDDITKRLFAMRYSPRSNFASQIHEVYGSLGAFGTGGIFSEEIPGVGITYHACNLAGLFIVEDYQRRVRYCHYKFELTAEQAAQRFTAEALPDLVKGKLADRPDDKATYIHCVQPNQRRIYGAHGPDGMEFESIWVCQDARQVVGRGGFRTFPYAVSRYVTRPGQVYGDSPGMMAFADVRMLNVMAQTTIQRAQLEVAPPLGVANDGILAALGDDGITLYPNQTVYGAVNDQGQQLVRPIMTGSNWSPIKEEIAERRTSVNAAFLVTLFQILVETPQMTATEALLRAQEKGALLAPTTGRQESELLGPIVEREIDLLAHAGALPPPPDVMQQKGGGYKLEYDNPMKKAQQAAAGIGLLRTIEAMAPLATANPQALDRFNPDEISKGLADINGVPSRWIRSDEEMTAFREGQQQQLQTQQLISALPAVSNTVKNLSDVAATQNKAQF